MTSNIKVPAREFFAPEFVNRIDEVVDFHKLMPEHMLGIVEVQMRHVVKAVNDTGRSITFDKAVTTFLAEAGYDPEYGARPLRRLIQTEVQDRIAEAMIKGLGNKVHLTLHKGSIQVAEGETDA